MTEDPFDAIEQMLAAMFGPQMAADAVAALRASGVDPERLAQMSGMGDLSRLTPAQLGGLQAQLQQLFAGAGGGTVNWAMGQDLALRTVRGDADPVITAADAERIRDALAVADLWLDAATDFMPAPGPREAWTRSKWVERTLPVWKEVCAPVADAATSALADALEQQINRLPDSEAAAAHMGALGKLMRSMAGTAFGLQLGQAIGELGRQAVAATDVGLPLMRESGTALVPTNVATFAAELEADVEQVRLFLAVREAAAARLYAHVPWLRSQLLAAVEAYTRGIVIDVEAVEQAVAQVDPNDPEAIRRALESGMFSPQDTAAQKEALENLETLLALVEGWVEVVTARALAPHLPLAVALREMVRRRRVQGGPAEQVFARLIGLEFRPRRVREAARLWEQLGAELGDADRDAFWRHPDVVPTAAELANPEDFLTMRRAAQDMDAQMDADLASLLDGTLGYADGAKDADAGNSESGQDRPEGH
ncbi:zinc-dependent metalloprotease [Actinomyces qiguomingii]|uniref:zinc-dependent metalloprotease n=1 Tax=Actinomyces qiguomingii TaxID=2057800 RepID=UPI000CA01025|nr:zinc-dependent metalloprotease [Actinomyces qiguomingii]